MRHISILIINIIYLLNNTKCEDISENIKNQVLSKYILEKRDKGIDGFNEKNYQTSITSLNIQTCFKINYKHEGLSIGTYDLDIDTTIDSCYIMCNHIPKCVAANFNTFNKECTMFIHINELIYGIGYIAIDEPSVYTTTPTQPETCFISEFKYEGIEIFTLDLNRDANAYYCYIFCYQNPKCVAANFNILNTECTMFMHTTGLIHDTLYITIDELCVSTTLAPTPILV